MKKILVIFLVLGVVCSASALFEPVFVGGRYVALGNANITEVYDPYAVIYNPAGLSGIKGISASVSFSEPFGVPGMNLINVNVGANLFDIVWIGSSFASYGVDIGYASGLRYTVAGGSMASSFDISEVIEFVDLISVGVSVKGLGMSLRGYEFDNSVNTDKWSFNVDGGINISLFEVLKLGVAGYNLVPYKFAFLPGSPGTEVFSALKVGVSFYLVKPYMKVFGAYSVGLNSVSPSSLSVGTEISYLDTIFTRIGLDGSKITMGLGVKAPDFEVNFGVQNRDNLGWYYQIDLVGFVDIF